MGAQGVVTVLPLQQEVLCSRGSNLWLQSLPGDGPLQAFVVEDSTWVLLLRPSSYSLLNFGANSGSQEGTLEGTLVLKGLNSEDLSHALQKVERLYLGTLMEHDHQFSQQAGPLEALLTPSFGSILAVLAGQVDLPHSPAPLQARVPPIFVASAGGFHCVLSHQADREPGGLAEPGSGTNGRGQQLVRS
eukprot:g32637.t1